MSSKTVLLCLDQMLDAAMQISEFILGYNITQYMADIKTQQAVAMNFILIGEAANRIFVDFPDVIAENSDIEWIKIRGLRNVLAHEYHNTDKASLFQTACVSIPILSQQIVLMISRLETLVDETR